MHQVRLAATPSSPSLLASTATRKSVLACRRRFDRHPVHLAASAHRFNEEWDETLRSFSVISPRGHWLTGDWLYHRTENQ